LVDIFGSALSLAQSDYEINIANLSGESLVHFLSEPIHFYKAKNLNIIQTIIRILSLTKSDSVTKTCLKILEICIPQENTIDELYNLDFLNLVTPILLNYSSEVRHLALNTIMMIIVTKISTSHFTNKLIENLVSIAVYSEITDKEKQLALNILNVLSKDDSLCLSIIENGAIKNLINIIPTGGPVTENILDVLVSLSTSDIARTIIMAENGYPIILKLLINTNVDIQIKTCSIIKSFASDNDFIEFVINNHTAEYLMPLFRSLEVTVLTAALRVLLEFSQSKDLIRSIKTYEPDLEFLQKLTRHHDQKISDICQTLYENLK